ncbi:hypothetical protein IFM89_006258 [Coptis chinensis]|uniref:Uncharacterized protein n=1 Tax=Coptis chinensis TaxID=261450 RepID=A0A835IX91_9MAGN|nr:hypothetical protein IFM89_006258 [Coptis chinensis]
MASCVSLVRPPTPVPHFQNYPLLLRKSSSFVIMHHHPISLISTSHYPSSSSNFTSSFSNLLHNISVSTILFLVLAGGARACTVTPRDSLLKQNLDGDYYYYSENETGNSDIELNAALETWKSKTFALTVPLRIVALRASVPPSWIKDFVDSQGRRLKLHFELRGTLLNIFSDMSSSITKGNLEPKSAMAADIVTVGNSWLSSSIKQGIIEPIRDVELQDWFKGFDENQVHLRRNANGELDPGGEVWAAPYRWGSMVIAYKKNKFRKHNMEAIEPSEPEPDPPQLEPVIEPSTEHELEPVDSDSESEPDVGLMLLFSKAIVQALPAPSLLPDDPSDPVVDMVHQGQEFDPSELIEPISGPSQNWTMHQITEESEEGIQAILLLGMPMEFLNSLLPPMGKQWYTGPFPQPRSLTDTKPNLYIKKGDPQRLSPMDWSDLWRPELAGKISMVDSPREVIGAVLKYMGASYNTMNVDSQVTGGMDAVMQNFMLLQKQVRLFDSVQYLKAFGVGDVWVAVGWSSDVIPAAKRMSDVAVVVPKSGASLWADLWAVPASHRFHTNRIGGRVRGPSPLIHQWMEFCLLAARALPFRQEVVAGASPIALEDQFEVSEESTKGRPQLETNLVAGIPPPEILAKCEFLEPLPESALEGYQWLIAGMARPRHGLLYSMQNFISSMFYDFGLRIFSR